MEFDSWKDFLFIAGNNGLHYPAEIIIQLPDQNMKISQVFLVVLLSFIAAFATVKFTSNPNDATSVQETAYERVLRTGVLRCGYGFWPKAFEKDEQTGAYKGIIADATEALGNKLHLKIEWTEEEGWSNFIESLKSHRIDMMCASVWRNAERGRYASFITPVFYNAIYPYVSGDDHRFDNDLSLANRPETHISTMDGEMSDIIAREHFPQATKVSIPQVGQTSDILMNVATHKADIVFTSSDGADEFIKSNPGKIRMAQITPYQIFPAAFAVDIHETELHDMLDSAMVELQNQGIIQEILKKYDANPRDYIPVAKPYVQTQ